MKKNHPKQVAMIVKSFREVQDLAVQKTNLAYRHPKQDQGEIAYWQGYNDAMAKAIVGVQHFFKTGDCACKECKHE